MTDDHLAIDRLLLDLAEGGLKTIVDNGEVRGMCRAALRNAGCLPPTDILVYFAVSKFVVLGAAKLSDGYSARLLAWMQRFKPAALVMRRIADICLKESNRNKLKDRLIAEMKGEAGPERPDFGTEAELEIQQQIYAMRRFDSIDGDLSALITLVQGLITERNAEGIAPRLGWDAGSTLSLSDTIRYNSGAYSFVGREDDLDFLRRFLAGEGRFSWLLLTGEGGEGKTRLAMEFTQRHLPEGWQGGRLAMGDLDRFNPSLWIPARPTCIVVDYPAQNPKGVRDLMASLARAATANLYDWPVRFILLERNIAGDWYRELLPETGEGSGLRSYAFRELLSDANNDPAALTNAASDSSLTMATRLHVYDKGWALTPLTRDGLVAMMRLRFEDEGLVPPADDSLWTNLTRVDPRVRDGRPAPRPIFAAAVAESLIERIKEGETAVEIGTADLDRIGILRSMIARDRQTRWQPQAKSAASLVLHENLLAMASFAYGLEKRRISELAEPIRDLLPSPSLHAAVPVETDLLRMMAGFEGGRIAPLEPDLLGEIHLIERLTAIREEDGDHAFRSFADGALTIGGEQAVTVAARIVGDFPELMPDLGWMIPAERPEAELLPQDARLAVDLVTTLPLEQVMDLFAWFDSSLDSAPDDLDIALAAARAVGNFVARSSRSPEWAMGIVRNSDRWAAIDRSEDTLCRALRHAIALGERTRAAFPEELEIALILARVHRQLAIAGAPEDRAPGNRHLLERYEDQAWRALEISEVGNERQTLLLPSDDLPQLLAAQQGDGRFRPASQPRPAGLQWREASPDEASRMTRLIARETLVSGQTRWLTDAGARAVWRSLLQCSDTLEAWAFEPASEWATQVVFLSDGQSIHLCDGSSVPLLTLAGAGHFRIDTPVRALDYLVLFGGLVRGDEGPFEIILNFRDLSVQQHSDLSEHGDYLPTSRLREVIEPPAVVQTGSLFRARANVRYGSHIFKSEFEISPDGNITMLDDEPLGEFPSLAKDRYNGIYRTYAEMRHIQLAAKLLNDAAQFFVSLASQNGALKEPMTQNADVFNEVARLGVADPFAELEGTPLHKIVAQLLNDAATFFDGLADQNSDVAEQMRENARVFRQVASLAEHDPLGTPGIVAEQIRPAPDSDP